ncbi:MAG: S8 family serine peptidase, partial [Defluviitaleaceae bacterium]|nr:S8 family serine peptidase [Defluviitaleaceae bacterium]
PNQELIFHFAANSGEGFISPGLWQLIITSRQSVLGDFNIWLPTTEEVGRRTGFSRPNPANTLTIPATAANVISVGGYNSADMAAAEFTGRGSGQMQKPDIVAPGVNVLSAKAGGGYDSFSGTSIAAPFAAGAAAALMEWAIVQGNDPDLYGQRLKAFLRLGAKRDPARQYPNNIWGYGTLCFANTLSYLQESHAPILAAARTNTSEYANMPMHEFVQNQNIIDVIVPNSSRLHEYAAEHPDIRIVANFCDNIALVYLPHENLDEFLDAVEANFIRAIAKPMGLLGRTSLIASGILQVQQRPYLDLRGRGVIVGFIDTGIDYTQPSFLYEDGSSKIKYIWDQTIEGQAAPDLLMGSEYSQEQINNALRSDNPYTIVPTRDTVGHGTFLASVAAGREDNEYLGAAPDAEIIAVKLRPLKDFYRQRFHIPSHIDEAYSTFDCMLGVKYILNKAAQLGRPAAICFSLGSTFGSHDGFNLIEEYLTECGRKRGVSISVAAGNESNTKGHTHGRLEKNGDTATIEVRVEENAPSMAMLFWNRPVDYMYITVKSPTGEIVGRAPGMKDIRFTQKLVLEKSTVNINYFFPIAGLGEDIIELFIDRPTPGIWTITLHGDIILDGGYHAWMPLSNFRQSGVEFITPTPQYTITIPGTAVGVITCGAYDQKNNSLYAASSWGPTRLPSPAPDLAAPGVDVLGAYPWGYGTMSGTSVAAAITTGAAALMLQWGIIDDHYKNLNNLRIRAFLQQGCTRDPGATYPSDQWGYGRLDLMQTFNILRSQY